MINNYECACERGGDCTRASMCAIQSALEDQSWEFEARIERLTSENSRMKTALKTIQNNYTKRGLIKRLCHQTVGAASTLQSKNDE